MNPLLRLQPWNDPRYMVGDATGVPTAAASTPTSPFVIFILGMGVGSLLGLFTMKVAGLI
jgi:hypothetical protein